MKQYADVGIATLQNALFDHMNSDDLKKLGALTKQKLPSRKGDLVDVIMRHLEGDGLQTAWRGRDRLQRAAVDEVVHSDLWGTDELSFFSRYDGLMYFRINPLGAYCLGMASAYQAGSNLERPHRT